MEQTMYQALNAQLGNSVESLRTEMKDLRKKRDDHIRKNSLTTRTMKDNFVVKALNSELMRLSKHLNGLKGKNIVGIKFV